MINPFLTNKSLKELIKTVRLDEDKKKTLLKELPKFGIEKREKLFDFLKQIYLLDLEQEKVATLVAKS